MLAFARWLERRSAGAARRDEALPSAGRAKLVQVPQQVVNGV
jgi:hypothetical protein